MSETGTASPCADDGDVELRQRQHVVSWPTDREGTEAGTSVRQRVPTRERSDMFPSRGTERVDLSTELGFALVGGVALVCAAPGRVGRRVTDRVTGTVDTAHDVAEFCTSRVVSLTHRYH